MHASNQNFTRKSCNHDDFKSNKQKGALQVHTPFQDIYALKVRLSFKL